jgi:uncharacterized protein with ATP-grasp and redox domains
MQLEPECIGCLFNQVLRAFKLVKPDVSREKVLSAQKKLMEYLLKVDINDTASPIIGKTAYGLVAETLGIKDPYMDLKKQYNQIALEFYEEAQNIVKNAEDPLLKALIISALGNTVDMATQHKIEFVDDMKTFSGDKFVINDYVQFKASLESTEHLLILGDNCGEIVFDKLLIETILKLLPDLKIIYSVRSAPIINDVTLDDAQMVGLDKLVKVIESSPTPGIDLNTSTEEFKHYFYLKGGMMLSKGQGNFESLYKLPIPQKEVYYLLKVKCVLMERIFHVNLGDLIFKKKDADF